MIILIRLGVISYTIIMSSSKGLKVIAIALLILTAIGFAGFAYEYGVSSAESSQISAYQSYLNSLSQSVSSIQASFTELNASLMGLSSSVSGMVNVTNSLNSQVLAAEQKLVTTPRIGIVTAMGMEQAPILAAMNVQGTVNMSGYTFYLGTIDGHAVVSVRSGEKEYAAELATYLMDTHFNIMASILSGTAGSRNPYVLPGDVVVGAMVVDKSSIHYHARGFQTDYTGVEMVLQPTSFFNSSSQWISGYGGVQPTPQDASTYGYGPSGSDTSYVYTPVLEASLGLVQTAEGASSILGTTSIADITGNTSLTGSEPASLMIGVIGSANQWTEPLSVMAAQNALYQTDAGENEGMGFAYANAQAGVPWVIVRGISDSPWYPATYHGVLASDRSANVTIYIVDHFSTNNLDSFASMNTLSPDSNAALHGYLIANEAYYSVSNVTQVQYQASNGSTIVVYNPSGNEYQLGNSNQFSQYVYTPSTNGTTSSSSGTSSSY